MNTGFDLMVAQLCGEPLPVVPARHGRTIPRRLVLTLAEQVLCAVPGPPKPGDP